LNAKGEGENSVESMLKRLSNVMILLSKDTIILKGEYEMMESRYSQTLGENQDLIKKNREKERTIQFLEKEVEKRTREYKDMTNTFEEFLSARAKQNRIEKSKKLAERGLKKC
jgi:hypothetical protein